MSPPQPPVPPRSSRSAKRESPQPRQRKSGKNVLVEVAKIAAGGVLGIVLAGVILKFGSNAGWFGRTENDNSSVIRSDDRPGGAQIDRLDGRAFSSLPRPEPRRKHPAPSQEVLAIVQAEIDGAFADELSSELTDQQNRDLARQIVQLAEDARDRPDERFGLLLKAGELAVEGGDLVRMDSVVAALAAEYEIDADELTETWVRRFAELADEPNGIESLVAHAKLAIDQALAEDRYDDALALAEATVAACQRPGGEKNCLFVQQGRDRIARLRDSWPEYQAARRTLESSPGDPKANLVVGRWMCLEKDAWNAGLVYLAKGGGDPLAEAARVDRAVASTPVQPDKSLQIADRWFDLAMANESHRGCLGRAFYWYRSVQGSLSGEQATHVDQRLDAIFREAASRGLIPEGGVGAAGSAN